MTNTIQTGSSYAHITEQINVQAYMKYLTIFAPAAVSSRLADVVVANERQGDQVMLIRSLKMSEASQPVMNGVNNGTVVQSQDKYRNTILQYAVAVEIENMVQLTYGGYESASWSRQMEDLRLAATIALSEGCNTVITTNLKGGILIVQECMGATDIGPITITDITNALNKITSEFAVPFTDAIEPTGNISTRGISEAMILVIPRALVATAKLLPSFTPVIAYGAGSKDRISSREIGSITTGGQYDVRIVVEENPSFNTPALGGISGNVPIYYPYLTSQQAFALVTLGQTSAKSLDSGKTHWSMEQMMSMALGLNVQIVENDISKDNRGGNTSLAIGTLFTAVARYCPLIMTTNTIAQFVATA